MFIFGFVSRIYTNSKSESKKHHTTANFTTAPRMYHLYCHIAIIGDRQTAISVCLVTAGRPQNWSHVEVSSVVATVSPYFTFSVFVPSTVAVRTYMIIRSTVNAILQTVFLFYEARKSVACCQAPAPLGRPGPRLPTQVPEPLLCKEQCRLT